MAFKSFSDLKKKRRDVSELRDKISKTETTYQKDERIWYPTADAAGNGSAVIRFLPPSQGEEDTFVKLFSHSFEHPKTEKWYIENSRTTLGEPDPVSDLNSMLWNSGDERDKDTARAQKRKLSYISNIYVVKDPKHPENEGKVFLYKYGQTVFDMIKNASSPKFDDLEAFDPFDMWEGANLKLRFRNKATSGSDKKKYRTYEDSEWGAIGSLFEDEEEMEKIWSQQHLLLPLVAPDQFRSYDELKKRLQFVLGVTEGVSIDDDDDGEKEEEAPKPTRRPSPKKAIVDEDDEDEVPVRRPPKAPVAEETKVSRPKRVVDDEEDDEVFDFQSLVDEDDE